MVTPARSLFSSSSFLSKQRSGNQDIKQRQPDSKLQVPWDDAGLLVIPGRVPSQLQDLCRKILHDGRHVNRSACPDPLGVVTFPEQKYKILGLKTKSPEQPVDPSNRELQTGSTGSGLGLSLYFAALSTSRHGLARIKIWKCKRVKNGS